MTLATRLLVWLCMKRLRLNQGAWVWLTLSIEGDEADAESNAWNVEQETPGQEEISRVASHGLSTYQPMDAQNPLNGSTTSWQMATTVAL